MIDSVRELPASMKDLPAAALTQVAEYFQALAEPIRLQILNLLRSGERRVGDIALHCGCTQANASRHLALLSKQGMVVRVSRGTSAYYSIADPAIYALCDLVCNSIACRLQRSAPDWSVFTRLPTAIAPEEGDPSGER